MGQNHSRLLKLCAFHDERGARSAAPRLSFAPNLTVGDRHTLHFVLLGARDLHKFDGLLTTRGCWRIPRVVPEHLLLFAPQTITDPRAAAAFKLACSPDARRTKIPEAHEERVTCAAGERDKKSTSLVLRDQSESAELKCIPRTGFPVGARRHRYVLSVGLYLGPCVSGHVHVFWDTQTAAGEEDRVRRVRGICLSRTGANPCPHVENVALYLFEVVEMSWASRTSTYEVGLHCAERSVGEKYRPLRFGIESGVFIGSARGVLDGERIRTPSNLCSSAVRDGEFAVLIKYRVTSSV